MKEKLEGIKNIMHTGYGAWTIMNFFFYYRITMDCKDQKSLSMITYQFFLILGCFSAAHVVFFITVVLILVPFILYHIFKLKKE
jgi:hypothetical protein